MPIQTNKTNPNSLEPTFNFKNGRLQSTNLDDFYINKKFRFFNRGIQLGCIFAYFIHSTALPNVTSDLIPDAAKFVSFSTWLKVFALMYFTK